METGCTKESMPLDQVPISGKQLEAYVPDAPIRVRFRVQAAGRDPLRRTLTGGADTVSEHYKFFSHTACEFYPCHEMPEGEELNCLFCFCPLYALGPGCGGDFRYVGESGGVKDCSACTFPHRRENYEHIMARFEEIRELAQP